jgi:hypothetical protein
MHLVHSALLRDVPAHLCLTLRASLVHITHSSNRAPTPPPAQELAISRDPGANFILETITQIVLPYAEIKRNSGHTYKAQYLNWAENSTSHAGSG